MDQQGSTPDINVGGASHSPLSSADNAGASQPSQPQADQQAANGDLLGRIAEKIENGQSAADTPSQSSPETPTPQTESQNQGQPTGDSVDPELVRWASSQNISLNTPTEINLAKRLRDTQTALHSKSATQRLEEAQNQLPQDEYVDPVDRLEGRLARFEFFESNPEAKALEPSMVDYCIKLAEAGDEVGFNYYRNNWSQLYKVVKAEQGLNPTALSEQQEAIRREERENLARVQQGAAPTAAANSSAPSAPVNQDDQIAKMSQAEYNEWRKSNNPFAR